MGATIIGVVVGGGIGVVDNWMLMTAEGVAVGDGPGVSLAVGVGEIKLSS